MPDLQHMAIVTKNNRRLARFYQFVFGMEEVWNTVQNSATAFYLGDGHFNLNCLQLRSGSKRAKIVDGREILPEVGINHIGFTVDSIEAIEKKLAEMNPPIKLTPSPKDGRYEDVRFDDPEGNPLELSRGGWDAGKGSKEALKVAHVGLGVKDPERLAEFYKSMLSMKEVGRRGQEAIYLSDGKVDLALVRNSPVPKAGFQVFGFKVANVAEVEDRIKRTMQGYLYPGEPPIEIKRRPTEGPYKAIWLLDPDGNHLDLSEGGWKV